MRITITIDGPAESIGCFISNGLSAIKAEPVLPITLSFSGSGEGDPALYQNAIETYARTCGAKEA